MIGFARDRVTRGEPLPGVFVCRQTLPDAVAIEQLVTIWTVSEHEEWQNLIVFLPL